MSTQLVYPALLESLDLRKQLYYPNNTKFVCLRGKTASGLYYKHTMIINYASSIVNKLEALLTDDAGVVI
jgi:hypothetical protein